MILQLLTGDLAAAAIAVCLANMLGVLPGGAFLATVLSVPPLVVMTLQERSLYRQVRLTRRGFPSISILIAWGHAVLAFYLACLALGPAGFGLIMVPAMSLRDSGLCLAVGAPLGAAVVLAWRLIWHLAGPRIARPAGRRVMVIGSERATARMVSRLQAQPGVEIVGVMIPERRSATRTGATRSRAGWAVEELVDLVRDDRLDTVLIASAAADPSALNVVLEQARMTTLDVHVLPELGFASGPGRYAGPLAWIGDLPVVELQRRPLRGPALALKRTMDLILGGGLLVLLLPVLVTVSVAVRLDSRGPILVRRLRAGLNGRPFNLFTFRTTCLTHSDGTGMRLTRMGRLLQQLRLDELPQIFNVIRGEMSMVGPRPAALRLPDCGTRRASHDDPARLRAKPGITGWAQVLRRGQIETPASRVRRLEHDLFYIETWTPWLDLLVLRKTISCLLSSDTAR